MVLASRAKLHEVCRRHGKGLPRGGSIHEIRRHAMGRIQVWASIGAFATAVASSGCASRCAPTTSSLASDRRLPPLEGTYEVQAPDARLAFDDAIHGETGPFAMLTGGAGEPTASAPAGGAAESE